MWLCIAFGLLLVTIFIMHLQSRQFFTLDVVLRKFSIMELEFPASAHELVDVIKGIYALPDFQLQKTIRALKGQLIIDFFFMPAAYASIFLICMQVSSKMSSIGHWIFAVLAWLQIIPWICDIVENVYLLKKIKPEPAISKKAIHKAYLWLEATKWGIPLLATVCGLSALFYYWVTGNYSFSSLQYLLIIAGEFVLFVVIVKLISKKL